MFFSLWILILELPKVVRQEPSHRHPQTLFTDSFRDLSQPGRGADADVVGTYSDDSLRIRIVLDLC